MDSPRHGRTGRLTDLTKLIVTFHNFSNAPKNCVKAFSYPYVESYGQVLDKVMCPTFNRQKRMHMACHFIAASLCSEVILGG